MARMLSSFNAKDHEKMGDFTPVPEGSYTAKIVQSELKSTKDNEGKYLQLGFQIIDGECNGKVIFERLNIQNKNTQTVEIAQKALATICDVCGVDELVDSEQLHGVLMVIKVTVRAAKAQYAAQNEIKGYEKFDGETRAASPGTSELPASAAAKAPGKTPPWKK